MWKLLTVLAVVNLPLATSYPLNLKDDLMKNIFSWINGNESANKCNDQPRLRKECTISLEQFSVYQRLGKGEIGQVYIVKKNGGLDDGNIYALKAINIPQALLLTTSNALNSERATLEAIKGMPFAVELHYAWRDGLWLFLVMDYVSGGNVKARIKRNPPDASTTKMILAEMVIVIEKMHNADVLHSDLHTENILIDSDGHCVLIDFGRSKCLSKVGTSNLDWKHLSFISSDLFAYPYQDEDQVSLMALLKDMTDKQLPELKRHPYFKGIDWEAVAEKKSDPPFKPNKIPINLKNSINMKKFSQSGLDFELEASFATSFQNYSFGTPKSDSSK